MRDFEDCDDVGDAELGECMCESCIRNREFTGHIDGRMLSVWVVHLSLRHGDEWVITPPFSVMGRIDCDAGDIVRSVKGSSVDLFDLSSEHVKVIHVAMTSSRALDLIAGPK